MIRGSLLLRSVVGAAACVVLAASLQPSPQHDHSHRAAADAPTAKPEDIEAEVRGNILAQSIGPASVGDLRMPDEFVRRVADRVIRASYEERYRIVVRDEPAPSASPGDALAPTSMWSRMIWAGLAALALTLGLTIWNQRRKEAA